jgi:uncharacterized YigZ family protein
MSDALIPASEVRNETFVVNSRFITSVSPAFSVDEARDFIIRIKKEFRDSSHNVPAFIIGHGATKNCHSNDDGEPSGTAGRPALAVLEGSSLGDIVVVVSRYFGGTKLGKGGLVRAYGNAVRSALSVTPIAKKTKTHTCSINIPYSIFEQTRLLIHSHQAELIDKSFMTDVTLTFRILTDEFSSFNQNLLELTHGKITINVITANETTIFPLNRKFSW